MEISNITSYNTINEYVEVCRIDPNKCGIKGLNWIGLDK